MVTINEFLEKFASAVWGLPLLILLIGGGFVLLLISRFIPFRYLGHAVNILRGKYDDPNDPGEISHFQALTTALSATIGMGNVYYWDEHQVLYFQFGHHVSRQRF